jgi:hypothetical protein
MAAITMKAVRSGTNMKTVTWAVNLPLGVPTIGIARQG